MKLKIFEKVRRNLFLQMETKYSIKIVPRCREWTTIKNGYFIFLTVSAKKLENFKNCVHFQKFIKKNQKASNQRLESFLIGKKLGTTSWHSFCRIYCSPFSKRNLIRHYFCDNPIIIIYQIIPKLFFFNFQLHRTRRMWNRTILTKNHESCVKNSF
jgi:hypothetical protein